MTEIDAIIGSALRQNRKTLSEWESARLLAGFGIPMARSILARHWDEVRTAAEGIGYPVVLKACSPEVSHKTEGGLVATDLRGEAELDAAFKRISAATPVKDAAFLIQEMVKGRRELVVGMVRDPQFGPCVMFGLGGIFTEILGDVTFRPAPLSEADAEEMIRDIKGHKILHAVRGMAAVDADILIACVIAIGRIGVERDEIQAIDVNPLIIQDGGQAGRPVAVDALVILKEGR
ncbi:MAG: carboxylate--amine ligase [Deltaproteobacteria bacterium]|nr:carboxylate--amine ligase [Deltaproteobacteria bacterium]